MTELDLKKYVPSLIDKLPPRLKNDRSYAQKEESVMSVLNRIMTTQRALYDQAVADGARAYLNFISDINLPTRAEGVFSTLSAVEGAVSLSSQRTRLGILNDVYGAVLGNPAREQFAFDSVEPIEREMLFNALGIKSKEPRPFTIPLLNSLAFASYFHTKFTPHLPIAYRRVTGPNIALRGQELREAQKLNPGGYFMSDRIVTGKQFPIGIHTNLVIAHHRP